jgi:hypothetical protein
MITFVLRKLTSCDFTKLINVMHSNVVSPKSMNVVFQRLDFAIQKGLAAQLIVRLHFIHV